MFPTIRKIIQYYIETMSNYSGECYLLSVGISFYHHFVNNLVLRKARTNRSVAWAHIHVHVRTVYAKWYDVKVTITGAHSYVY